MGFDDKISLEAAYKFKRDINKASLYILNRHQDIINNSAHSHVDQPYAPSYTPKKATSPTEQKVGAGYTGDYNCRSINDCLCVLRIKSLLQLYKSNGNDTTSFIKELHIKLDTKYTITYIIDDYVHIIQQHTKNNDFENLYEYINMNCDLEKCIGLKRNQRDRVKRTDNTNTTNNVHDIVWIDIMDQIHSNLLHSIDTGYRLTTKEKNIISKVAHKTDQDKDITDYGFVKMRQILNDKRKRFLNVMGTQNRINHSKFVTDHQIHGKIENVGVQNVDDIKQDDKSSHNVYSFSYRFEYWHENTCYRQLYVTPKYVDLKEEVMNNEICNIGKQNYFWNVIMQNV